LIQKALGRAADLESVVTAVADIADTLVSLHEEGYTHRDLKPDNIFMYSGRWVIGDFGLVEFPAKEALTRKGEKLGPAHFIAPEMLADARNADGRKADVYSLAKTFWVLATGQRFPPPGEQRVDVKGLTIAGYRVHPRVAPLDRVIEEATRHNPDDRITMAHLTATLRSWLAGS
jgi:serine/threonine protein kinase